MASSVKLNLEKLEILRKNLEEAKGMRVRVGVLGNKAERTGDDMAASNSNNPTIGLKHEFGVISQKLPMRSFLRMPLMTQLQKKIQDIGQAVFVNLIIKRGIERALKKLGVIGENTVQESFETGGWGQWPKLSAFTIRKKGPSAILIETAQLRKSVTSALEKEGKQIA